MASNYFNIPSDASVLDKPLTPVVDITNLPASGNNIGDTRLVLDTYLSYYWNGTTWNVIPGSGGGGVNSDVNIFDSSGNSLSSTSGSLNVDVTNTVPVTVSSATLPTGASTSANQTNGSQKTQIVDGSGNVIASTSNALNVDVTNTVPVTGAFYQATQPVSGTVTANAGTGTFAISASSLPLPAGAATNSELVTLNATLGSPLQAGGTVVATQSSGANLHVDVDNFPATQTVSGGVTVSGSVTATPDTSLTSSVTSVAGNASSVSLLASNSSRKAAYFFNDSTSTLFLKFGTTASASNYTVQLVSNAYYEMPTFPIYTGEIDGIWTAAAGNVRITELS